MGYAKSEHTRERLLKTTSKLLRTQGYAATGINDIIAESGVPKGSLYHHFPNGKTQLAAAAVAYANDFVENRLRALCEMFDSPADTVAAFCNFYIESLERSGFKSGCPIATVALETSATIDEIQRECGNGFELMIAFFKDQLTQHGVEPGGAEALAVTSVAAIEGALIICRARRKTEPLKVVRDHITTQIAEALT